MTAGPAKRRSGLATLLAAVAAAVVAAGCGVPTDASPRALPSSELPPALAVPLVTTLPAPPVGHGHGVYVPVYFLFANNTELREVATPVRQRVTLQTTLQALEAGPSSDQYADGYETAIPSDSDLEVIGPAVRGILPLALDSAYYQLSEQFAIYELAQVVYTLSESAIGLKGIQFYRKGAKTGVFAGNGQYITGPVSRNNYASLFSSTGSDFPGRGIKGACANHAKACL